jgi:hypothetical protein
MRVTGREGVKLFSLNPLTSERIYDKIQKLRKRGPNERIKNLEKSFKKGLTNSKRCDIIDKHSKREQRKITKAEP